jgi:thiol-disulfide isomerase/thioredoxin
MKRMRWRKQVAPWALTIFLALLYAWSLTRSGFSAESRPLPQFKARVFGGDAVVSNASLAGKPAIINIWSPSCFPCRQELPGLDRLASAYAGRVSILGLMGWGTEAQGAAVGKAAGITHLPLYAGGESLVNDLSVDVVPTTVFVNAQGTIVGRVVGMESERTFRKQADELLAGTPLQ